MEKKEKTEEIAIQEYIKIVSWLWENHRSILEEYEDKFCGGKRIMFAK
jgi:hypothetical protein